MFLENLGFKKVDLQNKSLVGTPKSIILLVCLNYSKAISCTSMKLSTIDLHPGVSAPGKLMTSR